jgi:hypothetical protein
MSTTATLPLEKSPVYRDIDLRADDFVVQEQVQQRADYDLDKVHEYAALYKDGRDLGRIVVFFDRKTEAFILADGFHRHRAAMEAGLTTLPAEVHEGTVREALFYATGCNLHGKPLTNADKRKRVMTLLHDPEWSHWSDKAIARHCGVTQPFVGTLRKSLITVISDEKPHEPSTRTYQDKYGHVHTMDTSKIGQRVPETPVAVHTAIASHGTGTSSGGSIGSTTPPILTEVLEPEPPAVEPSPTPARFGSGDAEWYTPPAVVKQVREVLGGTIDLDPASCAEAQRVVDATTYYTTQDDGLRQSWHGTVFVNPPYKMPLVARFVGKLVEELDARHTTATILLVNNATQTDWFQFIAQRADVLCFPDGKIPFTHATRDDSAGPLAGQVLLYFGPHVACFCEVFGETGLLLHAVGRPVDPDGDPRNTAEAIIEMMGAAYALDLADEIPRLIAPLPAPAAPAPTAAPRPQRKSGALQARVWEALKQHQPCSNAQVAKVLGEERKHVHKALQSLVRHGKARQDGVTYYVKAGADHEPNA